MLRVKFHPQEDGTILCRRFDGDTEVDWVIYHKGQAPVMSALTEKNRFDWKAAVEAVGWEKENMKYYYAIPEHSSLPLQLHFEGVPQVIFAEENLQHLEKEVRKLVESQRIVSKVEIVEFEPKVIKTFQRVTEIRVEVLS